MKRFKFLRKKIWPVLVSLSGASVMLLAFFLPSVQEQWDRYESRKVIEQYEKMGDDFFSEERYAMAEESYAKAFGLSEEKRLDIEVKRLRAKVNKIGMDPDWGSKPPEDIKDIDFQMLLHLEKGTGPGKAQILNSYGIFLASKGRIKEAQQVFQQAVAIDPVDVLAYVNMGNLLDQLGKKSEAEQSYRKAISLEPDNARAHYNLALLLEESGRRTEAQKEMSTAVALDPGDADARTQLELLSKPPTN